LVGCYKNVICVLLLDLGHCDEDFFPPVVPVNAMSQKKKVYSDLVQQNNDKIVSSWYIIMKT
jgi:hypothetical protein